MKYIAKPNTWFDEGTEVILIDDYSPDGKVTTESGIVCGCGLFKGHVNGKLDEEVCDFEEFNIIED